MGEEGRWGVPEKKKEEEKKEKEKDECIVKHFHMKALRNYRPFGETPAFRLGVKLISFFFFSCRENRNAHAVALMTQLRFGKTSSFLFFSFLALDAKFSFLLPSSFSLTDQLT